MAFVRSIILVFVSCILFAIAGAFISISINSLTPGYYPGVLSYVKGYASEVGKVDALFQGAGLGLFVGTVVVVGLGWFGQLTQGGPGCPSAGYRGGEAKGSCDFNRVW